MLQFFFDGDAHKGLLTSHRYPPNMGASSSKEPPSTSQYVFTRYVTRPVLFKPIDVTMALLTRPPFSESPVRFSQELVESLQGSSEVEQSIFVD